MGDLLELYDRFIGIPFGVAFLDAKHAPRETARIKDGSVKYIFKSDGKDGWNEPLNYPGNEFTDDFLLTFATMGSIVRKKRFAPEDIAIELVNASKSYPYSFGRNTTNVFKLLNEGNSWEEAGKKWWNENPNSAGNGSIMRCSPIAMIDYDNINKLVHDSIMVSLITHYHPFCVQGCIFLNTMIESLIKGDSKEKSYYKAKDVLHESLPSLKELCSKFPEKLPVEVKSPKDNFVTGYVVDTLNTALDIFMNSKSFVDADNKLSKLEGDVDTAGAVLGALAGAHYGYKSIPNEKCNIVNWEGHKMHDKIMYHSNLILKLKD